MPSALHYDLHLRFRPEGSAWTARLEGSEKQEAHGNVVVPEAPFERGGTRRARETDW